LPASGWNGYQRERSHGCAHRRNGTGRASPHVVTAQLYAARDFNFRKTCPEIPNTTYLTHKLHAYPAKFIPHIPRWFLREYGHAGGTMLDPFCGSGTALVEANLLGMHALGVDINPLTRLLLRAKTELVEHPDDFARRCLQAAERAREHAPDYTPEIPSYETWFLPQAREELARIFGYLLANPDDLPEPVRDFMLVCASATVRKVCNADPRISKPFISRQMRARLKAGTVEQRALRIFERTTRTFLDRKIKYMRMLSNLAGAWGYQPKSRLVAGSDARTLTGIGDHCVNAIVTSPPYANAQEYFRSIKLELYWLNLIPDDSLATLNRALVGTERLPAAECQQPPSFGLPALDRALNKIFLLDRKRAHIVLRYFQDMRSSIEQCYRVLKPGGYFGLLVGDNVIRKVPLDTHSFLQEIAERVGFSTEEVGYDRIVARGLAPKRHETAGLIDVEWMLVFRKMGF